ncbi:MAG: rhodanese-like domain-containing protein [Phocaeicola sp.]|uniref:rhodanese-like domain-containing protein n=1 Tax=Phocaeicola sp. TaxID=2773926 RepID=UPI0023C63859|nr:rhodanese-like domain-containing protein [Phocaeicola sp.]MDE5676642.1 rhodanese-like domain-containing protein [Phocaeicola sp.]MDE6179708.1 rhodanese-like domain-containing protein [Phocaeicola sp.]
MIKTIYFLFFICAFSLGLWACTGKQTEKFKNLSSDQFEDFIQSGNIQLVDVRTVAEYSEEHIPGSINLNVLDNDFGAHIDEVLQKDIPVAVYCRSGRRSRNAANILVKKGFKVYNLDKGILDWKELGKDTEK